MNFKPAKLKVILSIIVGGVLGFFSSRPIFRALGFQFEHNNFLNYYFAGTLIGIVIMYLIWSLIQKK